MNEQDKKTTRKASISVIKKTETKKLALGQSAIYWGRKVEKIDKDLEALPNSNVRCKITKGIQLRKERSRYVSRISKTNTKVNELGEKLKGYEGLTW